LAFTWADCLATQPRTAASACLRNPQDGFMPQCQSGRSSKSSKPLVRAMELGFGSISLNGRPPGCHAQWGEAMWDPSARGGPASWHHAGRSSFRSRRWVLGATEQKSSIRRMSTDLLGSIECVQRSAAWPPSAIQRQSICSRSVEWGLLPRSILATPASLLDVSATRSTKTSSITP
jgi:hypothetical protein